jgi:HAMP domain-containing protein
MFVLICALGALLTAPRLAPIDTVRARVVAAIGEDAPRTPFLLGEVSGLAFDASGRLYVADVQEPRVVIFDSTGRHLATVGRKGEGPGEFTAPTGPIVAGDGTLYVRNMSRVQHFVKDPKSGLPTKFDRHFEGPLYAPWRSKLPSQIDGQGRFHFPREAMPAGDMRTRYAFQRFRLDGTPLDSLGVPLHPTMRASWASVPISLHSGRMVPGLNVVPFHPVPVFAVSAIGTVFSSAADRYLIIETDATGRVVRQVSRSDVPQSIPAPERAESTKALSRRIDTLKVPLAQVEGASEEVRARRLPLTYPAIVGLAVASDGALWVRRWALPTSAPATVFDVFGADGRFRETIRLPMRCAPQPSVIVRGALVACVVLDPASGAEQVVIFSSRPA